MLPISLKFKSYNGYRSPALNLGRIHRNLDGDPLTIRPRGPFAWFYQELWKESFRVMKSTQCGISEFMIVSMLTLAEVFKARHIYMLPNDRPIKHRFVRIRINRLRKIPYYAEKLKDDNEGDNDDLKFYDGVPMTFIGSKSEAAMHEFSADAATIDEEDQCDPENMNQLEDRYANSDLKLERRVGNPTVEKYGSHKSFLSGTQHRFYIRGDCGHWIQPDFFKHLINDEGGVLDPDYEPGKEPRLICHECQKPFDRYGDGTWVDAYSGRVISTQISQLFTAKVSLERMVNRYHEGLSDPRVMQGFYNKVLGLPYVAAGAKLSKALLDAKCLDVNFMPPKGFHEGPCFIGVDQGHGKHHYVIVYENRLSKKFELVAAGWIPNILGPNDDPNFVLQKFDEIIERYNVINGVIDAAPEKHLANAFTTRWRHRNGGGFFRCRYLSTNRSEQTELGVPRVQDGRLIQVDRTNAMDEVVKSIQKSWWTFPANYAALDNREFLDHLCAPTKYYDEDRKMFVFTELSKDDHYYHAMVYALLAINTLSLATIT